MSNPYAPPTVNEFKTGNRFLGRIPGFVFVMLGLIMPVILTILGGLPIGLGGNHRTADSLCRNSDGGLLASRSIGFRKATEKLVAVDDSCAGNSDYRRNTLDPHGSPGPSGTAGAAGSDVSKRPGSKGSGTVGTPAEKAQ